MPIQIIPKEAAKLPLWHNILFYLSIGLVLSTLAAFGILYYFTNRAGDDVKRIEESIQKAKTPQILSLEEELISLKDKVDNFSSLIANHKIISNFFGNFELKTGILEKDIHPKVTFTEMTLDAVENEVTLSGETENLEIIGQQVVYLFQNDEMLQDVRLSKAEINKEGKIDFTLNIAIKPGLFRVFESSK